MKSILTSLCDFSVAWEGLDALYFSKCSKSINVPIVLREFIFVTPKVNMMLAGTSSPTSVQHCAGWFTGLAGAPTSNAKVEVEVLLAKLYKMAFSNMFAYMSIDEEENADNNN